MTMSEDTSPDRRKLLRDALRAVEQMQAKLDEVERARTEPIAIVGVGCRYPGGIETPDALWSLLERGVDAVTEVPSSRWPRDVYAAIDPAAAAGMPKRYRRLPRADRPVRSAVLRHFTA